MRVLDQTRCWKQLWLLDNSPIYQNEGITINPQFSCNMPEVCQDTNEVSETPISLPSSSANNADDESCASIGNTTMDGFIGQNIAMKHTIPGDNVTDDLDHHVQVQPNDGRDVCNQLSQMTAHLSLRQWEPIPSWIMYRNLQTYLLLTMIRK